MEIKATYLSQKVYWWGKGSEARELAKFGFTISIELFL